jgi:predicted Co/Zn/Cd cation transporter (cation efflux family)
MTPRETRYTAYIGVMVGLLIGLILIAYNGVYYV